MVWCHSDLYGAERKYNAALDSCLEVHRKGQYLVDVRATGFALCVRLLFLIWNVSCA
jgi:hypothetical protein